MRPIQPSSDAFWMGWALTLARRMRGYVWPNPPVGCVIVKGGATIAEQAGAIPEGADALLETRGGGRGLRLRDPGRLPELACDLSTDGDLLRRLGGLGLTSVALWREDPLRAVLTPQPA